MKFVKKLLVIVGAALLISGCSKKEESKDLYETIKERGEIIVAMEGQWKPWTYHDESDALVGFDTEVATAIAKELGVNVKFVEGEWDGLFAGLDDGRYDLIVNGVDVTEERSQKYDFSDPYAFMRTALIVRNDNTDIKSFEDLKGKTTCNSNGSTYMTLAESFGANCTAVDSLNETMEIVIQGRADATLNAELSFYDYMGEKSDAPLKVVALTEEANYVSIPMRKGAETATLRAAINDAIKTLRDNGTLAELSNKYFGTDITKE